MRWIKEVDLAKSIDDLSTSQSTTGRVCPKFETLNARIAISLRKILQNSNFKRWIHLEEQRAQKGRSIPKRRQVAIIIHEHFWVTGTHKSILDFSDLQSVVLRGNDFQGFDAKWDEILLSITEIPADPCLERFDKMGRRESEQLKSVLALYDQDIKQKEFLQAIKNGRLWRGSSWIRR